MQLKEIYLKGKLWGFNLFFFFHAMLCLRPFKMRKFSDVSVHNLHHLCHHKTVFC